MVDLEQIFTDWDRDIIVDDVFQMFHVTNL